MVLPASDGIPRVPPYSGSAPEGTGFRLQGFYLLWRAFPDRFVYPVPLSLRMARPTTPRGLASWFGLFPFRSPLLRKSLLLSSPPGTEMFQFPGLPSIPYVFRYGYHPITDGGFPHSDTPGSTPAYGSPRRFAVRRVLHRLLVPRHPPCALTHLTLDWMSLSSFQGTSLWIPSKLNKTLKHAFLLFLRKEVIQPHL